MSIVKRQLLDKIASAWAGTHVEAICLIIVDQLCNRANKLGIIDVSTLDKWTVNKFTMDELLDAALFLCGRNPHLLEQKFYFNMNDEDDEYPLSTSEVHLAQEKGYLSHPLTGKLIYNYSEYIYFYFTPSLEAKMLVC